MLSPNPFTSTAEAKARVAALRAAMETRQLRAVVIGAGRSGSAAAALLRAKGHDVRFVDDRSTHSPITEDAFVDADLAVLSPGVPRSRKELSLAIARGIVVGEIELASWFVRAPLIGITGTNGKSTTTALVGHILASAGLRVFVGGNLGRPLSELALSGEEVDFAVVELSSYQLESIVDATFLVACWLNLTPDHTDRYESVEHYAAAKARIIERRSVRGVAVLNAKSKPCSEAGISLGGPIRWFSAERDSDLAGPSGTRLLRLNEAVRADADRLEAYRLDNPKLPGLHNRANMLAAIECARAVGVSEAAVEAGLLGFEGLPHRLELIRVLDGVSWYNDSKATNVDSTQIALRAVEAPKILIAGGRDKGAPWTPLCAEAHGIRAVLAIGEASEIVVSTFEGQVERVERAGTLESAVALARAIATPGDAVLLSPACASFDQFDNYEHRGEAFRALVLAMGGDG